METCFRWGSHTCGGKEKSVWCLQCHNQVSIHSFIVGGLICHCRGPQPGSKHILCHPVAQKRGHGAGGRPQDSSSDEGSGAACRNISAGFAASWARPTPLSWILWPLSHTLPIGALAPHPGAASKRWQHSSSAPAAGEGTGHGLQQLAYLLGIA